MSIKSYTDNTIKPVETSVKQPNNKKTSENVIEKSTNQNDKAVQDKITIEKLKEKSDRAYQNLRRMVEELLRKQGLDFKRLDSEKELEIKIDDETRAKAKEAIEEGGEHSIENVSDRIVDFAKAISGGDRAKFDLLKESIEEGFEQVRDAFGGKLPEISEQTYDRVMEKLESWRAEGEVAPKDDSIKESENIQ